MPVLPRLGWMALGGLAFVVRLLPVLLGGGLTGILAYDDGVYYAASDALLSGRMPYRDYVFLHPPGIALVLAPFAALGRLTSDPTGMAVGRVAFMLVGALTAVLVWRVASRLSVTAGWVAGTTYAVWQPAVYAERTTRSSRWSTWGWWHRWHCWVPAVIDPARDESPLRAPSSGWP